MTTRITTYAQALQAQETDAIAEQLIADLDAAGFAGAGFGDRSVPSALVQLQAAAQNQLQRLRVILVKAGIPTTASEAGSDWVDVTLSGFFQETRFPAIAARWQLQLLCAPSAGPYTIAAKEAVAQDQTGTTYTNLNRIQIAAGGTALALFEARTPGVVGNAAPGLIDHLVIGKPGLSVTNAAPGGLFLGGTDAESDAAYLTRCMGKWGIISAGASWEERVKSVAAYDFLVPGAAPTVTRWLVRDDNPFGPGTIGICLANAAGPATAAEVKAVSDTVKPLKPVGCQTIKVFPADAQNVAVRATLYTPAAHDGAQAAITMANAQAALAKLVLEYPIGSLIVTKLFLSRLIEVLMEVPGMINVVVAAPVADVGLAPYAVILFSPAPVLTLAAP